VEYVLPFGIFIAYIVVGAAVLKPWTIGWPHYHPWDLRGSPDGWLRFWFPRLVIAELWLVSGAVGFWQLVSMMSSFLGRPDAFNHHNFTSTTFLVGSALMVWADVVLVIRARRLARARRM
jgi:hypothetical protein